MTFFEEVKKPFNIITLILAIAGIILSIFFYYKSEKVKGLSYLLNNPPSLIFDSKNSSSAIKLFEKDSILVNGDVYLLTGSIWNSGDFPILKDDIRLPLSIDLNNSSRILDFKINKQKDSTVSNFVLSEKKPNSLSLNWKYFDPGFGFTFQIMYVGNHNSGFKINGKLLDIKEFKEIEKVEKKNGFLKWWNLILPALIIIYLSFLSIKRKIKTGRYDKFSLIFILITFILFLVSVWMYFIYETISPI